MLRLIDHPEVTLIDGIAEVTLELANVPSPEQIWVDAFNESAQGLLCVAAMPDPHSVVLLVTLTLDLDRAGTDAALNKAQELIADADARFIEDTGRWTEVRDQVLTWWSDKKMGVGE